MRIVSEFLKRLHLDKQHLLLTGRAVQFIKQYFDDLDARGNGELDDVQFVAFMSMSTNLNEQDIYKVFDMFDVDHSGSIEFDEFYLLICMLVAIKDHEEKQFLWRHSRTCFELLDADGSNAVSMDEFETFGFIFNISKRASRRIFKDFDVDESKELDYEEFRMFTLACIDKQTELDYKEGKVKREPSAHNNRKAMVTPASRVRGRMADSLVRTKHGAGWFHTDETADGPNKHAPPCIVA